MPGAFFESGCPVVLGEHTFTMMPLTISQLRGDLLAWARQEPIRKARAAQALIESCRDILGADTDAEKKAAILRGVEQSLSPDWDEGGHLYIALVRSRHGLERQLWMSAKESAEQAGVSEAEFISLLRRDGNADIAAGAYLKATGVPIENPPTATRPQQIGSGSTSPLQSASDTPPVKSVN